MVSSLYPSAWLFATTSTYYYLDDPRLLQKRANCQIPDADNNSNGPADAKVVEAFREFFLRGLGNAGELALELQMGVRRDRPLVPLVSVPHIGGDADGPLSADPHTLQESNQIKSNQIGGLLHKDHSSSQSRHGIHFMC